MTGNDHRGEGTRTTIDYDERGGSALRTLSDPTALRGRADVPFEKESVTREDHDHGAAERDGRSVVGVRNDDGELLVLVNGALGIAVLPWGDVDPDGDWAAVARRGIEALTGISIELGGVEYVRDVEYVLDGEDDPHARTYRVVFSGSAVGGEIQECKRSAEAGSDPWEARWVAELPTGLSPAEGSAGDDLELFLE